MWPFSSPYPTVKPSDIGVELGDVSRTSAPTFNYIIVGGGIAGCCLASRLSEDPDVTVLLIERGIPLISSNIFKKDSLARPLNSLPQVHADHRVIPLMRGQALGGTSRVNGMFYTRGVPADFNRWRDMGHPDWSYEKMLPFFVKSENTLSHPESTFRGKNGPWENQTFSHTTWPIIPHVKATAEFMRVPFYPDCNDPSLPSISCVPVDIAIDRNMRRCSTYSAFLPPSIARSRQDRLKICPDTIAERVAFNSRADGPPRAIGVEFGHRDGTGATYFAKASREVVVCGAIESPQLLLLSGIGPSNHLKQHGIGVIVDNPGVRSNLKDHVDVPMMWNIPLKDSLHPFAPLVIFLPSQSLNENTEIVAPDPADLDSTLPHNGPDLEIKPIPLYGLDPPPNATTVHVKEGVMNFIASCDLRMLSDPEDLAVLAKGVQLSIKLAEQVRAQGYPIKTYHRPISDSGEDIEVYIRSYARSGYHYTSTRRMAPFGGMHLGVVDDELRVHGVDGLRVCDASVFPDIMAAHTMAPVVVVAEKRADMRRRLRYSSK
ncbi:alcohol oxidase [Armillaria novae-zelandiae]|uniref:Alcohol oxidase n=1 Tax=Armillaria novae-zelandiae TaxID=153914 RepID=A0AA39P8M3_9AGAR|nr:alcohol oxidase [Armillaria novae-zelandiae]